MKRLAAGSYCVLISIVKAVLLAACLISLGCQEKPPAPPPALQITGQIPRAGEKLGDRLVVVFDRPLSPHAADEATSPPLRFEPPLDGKFEYGPNFIGFKPDFAASDALVTATLSQTLAAASGGRLTPTTHTLFFTSREFMPERLWHLDEATTRTVLALSFTMPIDPAGLPSRLKVLDARDAALPYKLEPSSDADAIRILLAPGLAWPLRAYIAAGVPEEGRRFGTPRETTLTTQLAKPMGVSSANWAQNGPNGQEVAFYFPYNVDGAELQRHLKITDISTTAPAELKYAIVGSGLEQNWRVRFAALDPQDVKVRLDVSAGLKSAAGVEMPLPWTAQLASRAALAISNASFMNEPEHFALRLGFNYPLDLAQLKSHLSVDPMPGNLEVTSDNYAGYTLHASWEEATTYHLTITPGLPFADWARLRNPLDRIVTTPKSLPGFFSLPEVDKFYMPRRFGTTIPMQTRGVKAVTLRLYKMIPANIALAVDDLQNGRGDWRFITKWSLPAGHAVLHPTQTPGQIVTTPIALDTLTSAPLKGVYCLSAVTGEAAADMGADGGNDDEDMDPGYRGGQTRIVIKTDLGLLAHWDADELSLFAHNLFTLAPAADAQVSVYSFKNVLLGSARTDGQGLAHLRGFAAAKGDPYVVVVEKGTDYTFLRLSPRQEGRMPFEGGRPAYDAKAYDAFFYADRELYRPGETVHLRWIVRRNYGDAVADAPLIVSVVKPGGTELLKRPIALGPWGTASLDLPTQADYPTGSWHVALRIPGRDAEIGGYDFQVEEFVPNRMKVSAKFSEPRWVYGAGQPEVVVNAQHLFGSPAEGRRASAELSFSRGFGFAEWPAYRFDNDTNVTLGAVPLGDATTDAKGEAHFALQWTKPAEVTYPLHVHATSRVVELGGRAVPAGADAMFFPSPICLGIAGEPGARKGEALIRVVAVAPDGKPANLARVRVTLEKQVWNYYVRRMYTNYEADWSGSYQTVTALDLALHDGVSSTTVSAPEYGSYRVRIDAPETPQFSTISFFSYGGNVEISKPGAPSLIHLELDKPSYRIGDRARLRVQSAFDGRGILIVRGEHIQRVIPFELKQNTADIDLPVDAAMSPNVWLEATVIHAVEAGHKQVYPFSSFEMIPLTAADPRRSITVDFPGLPDVTEPAHAMTIDVRTRDASGKAAPAEVTLAAVDEGIHSITGYRNPAPVAWFARPRRSTLLRNHYYDLINDDWQPPAAGGDEEEVAKRLRRPAQNWIRTVALWSGPVRTGPDGRAHITLQMPEFNGQLRLVAVAVDAQACGVASSDLYVRRPWILSTSLPRFMLPGDRAAMRATIYNNSESTCTARVDWATSGTLALLDAATSGSTARIRPHGEMDVTFEAQATTHTGQAAVRWHAEILDPAGRSLRELSENDPLPIELPAGFQSDVVLSAVAPGAAVSFPPERQFLQDDLFEITLTAGASPLLRLQKSLMYVVGYPYGCVEQTTSKLLALYLLRRDSGLLTSVGQSTTTLDSYIRAGIDRLFSMQTASGGLAFWPGLNQPYAYGSVYALHFLTLVNNDRQIPLDRNNFQILQEYVRGLAHDATDASPSALYQRAYATYVLALAGDKEAPDLIARFDHIEMPGPGRHLLAAALAVATHDADRVALYLKNAPIVPYDLREFDGTLSSPERNEAVDLISLVHEHGDAQAMAKLADELARYIETSRYLSTHEQAFIIAALDLYLETLTTDSSKAKATIEWPGGEAAIEGTRRFTMKLAGGGAKFTVRNTGASPIYVTSAMRGLPLAPLRAAVHEGIGVERRLLTPDGQPLAGAPFRQGRSYVVELALRCDHPVKNLVVTDLLPGGFEIENPRLNRDDMPGVKLPHGSSAPGHLELRDDRLVLVFDSLGSNASPPSEPYYFYYVVNAVTPGIYQYPAAEAECMYDPGMRGASAPETIEVAQ